MTYSCGPEHLVEKNSFFGRGLNGRAWYKPLMLGAGQLCVHVIPCEDHSSFDFISAVHI